MSNQPVSPTPPPQAKSIFLSGKLWLILGLAVVLCSCLICGGILSLSLFFSEPTRAVGDIPSPAAPGSGTPAAPSASPNAGPDEVLYRAPDGAIFVPTFTITARGAAVPLAGTWREDRRGFLLQLNADNSYKCEDGGSAGRSAATTTETGTWASQDNVLHLTPTGLTLHAISGTRHINETHTPGAPYDLSIEGLTLQYVPYDTPNAPPRTIDGLALQGKASPGSDTPSRQWNFTLRRAP